MIDFTEQLMPNIGLHATDWYKAYKVYQLDEPSGQRNSLNKWVAALFPNWYSSFKIASLVPQRRLAPRMMHGLGKVFFPREYAAFQMAKMKSAHPPAYEKALALLFPGMYGGGASAVLLERQEQAHQRLRLALQSKRHLFSFHRSEPTIRPLKRWRLPVTRIPSQQSPYSSVANPYRLMSPGGFSRMLY